MTDNDVAPNAIFTIVDLMALSITVGVTVILILSFSIQDIKTDRLELQNLVEATMQSTFAYQDPITKSYHSGMIGVNQFKELNLTNEIKYNKSGVMLKYQLFKNTKQNSLIDTKYYVSHSNNAKQSYERALQRMINVNRFVPLSTEDNPIEKEMLVYDENTNEYFHGRLKIVAIQET